MNKSERSVNSIEVNHGKLKHGVPSIAKRIDATYRLIEAGWMVGLRFDPAVYHQDYQSNFIALLNEIFFKHRPNVITFGQS
ncbi:MAG: hypothetical protein GY896_07890 [Gammaproteobacteria bacterium]|nr:hypothetical protein [Gammaproteobacteria bacterium]